VNRELQKAKDEILSYKEIIRVLQEELNANVRSEPKNELCKQSATSFMEEDWVLGSAKSNRKRDVLNRNLIQIIPTSPNKYDLLHNLKEDDLLTGVNSFVLPFNFKGSAKHSKEQERMNIRLKETRQKGILEKKQHTVMVIGDSHARGCAAKLMEKLGKSFEVTGIVKPGTGLEVITSMEAEGISKRTKKDVVVIWGGSNDIAKNAAKTGLKHMAKFMKGNSHTNIVILAVPQRHDLSILSCVNNEVIVFNRKLQKMMMTYNNMEILDVDISRGHFTRHGLHMNEMGKEKMASKISEDIKKKWL
jgi:hypothetical protein